MLFAAVVIPVVRRDVPTLVFVRRATHLRRNPGQIAFPGGLIDPDDGDAEAAALREFEEELGVPRRYVRVVGRLRDVVTLALSVTIAPFVGVLEPPLQFVADGVETQSVHEVPLAALYAPGALHEGIESVLHQGRAYEVGSWLFDYGELHVWGATARILRDFVVRYPSPDDLDLAAAARCGGLEPGGKGQESR